MGDNNQPAPPVQVASDEHDDRAEDSIVITSSDGDTSITIHRHFCKGCEICAEVCPKDVLRMVVATDRWEGTIVDVININNCNACMLCEHQCPDFAIEVFNKKKDMKKKEKQEVGN